MANLTLILGGIASGKSRYAESLFEGEQVATYVATYRQTKPDRQMAERLVRHRQRRSEASTNWQLVETPLLEALPTLCHPTLIDSITMWLADQQDYQKATATLLKLLGSLPSQLKLVVVAELGGMGGVSTNTTARHFADASGELNQHLAHIANRVELITAGIPQTLKP